MEKIWLVFSMVHFFSVSFQISAQWVMLNSPHSNVNDLYISNNGKILCACDSGLYYSIDNFQNWDNLIDLPVKRIKRDNYGNIYATSTNLYKSTDQGLSWHVPYNASLDSIPQYISNIFINDSGYIFTVQFHMQDGFPTPLGFKSADFGETWDRIWKGTVYSSPWFYTAWSIIENNTGTLFVSYTYFDPYYRETKIIKKVLGGDWVTLFDDTEARNMYIFNQALYFATGSGRPRGVIKSTDDGNTFTQLTNGLSFPDLVQQLILKSDIFVALDPHNNAIFYSYDEGENWSPFNLGGLNSTINSVYLDDNRTLYACTDSGIYVYTGPLSVEDKISQTDFSLLQNYPNPFNPSTNIQYAISSRQFVTLKVFDVLGKEITTLVNEEKPAGSYEVEFKSSFGSLQLASGIYYYQLRAGDFIETKKMILMK